MRARVLLATAILVATVQPLYLWAGSRLMRGHDSFAHFALQYTFAANAAQGGGFALWLPNATQGTASSLHPPGMFLPSLLILAGPLFKGLSFLPLFYLGLFLKVVFLLLGVWLLGRRLYRTTVAAAFASIAAAASCMWLDQIWFNLEAFFVVPLVIAGLHAYLEEGRRAQLFIAGNLFVLNACSNAAYLAVLSAFVVCLYFLCFAVVGGQRVRAIVRTWRPRWSDVFVILGIGATLALVLGLVLPDHGEVVIRSQGRRDLSGGVALDEFLTYAGHLSPLKYLEFLTSVPVSLDNTLFCGFATVALAGLAFINSPDRRTLHLFSVFLLVVVLSAGYLGFVAGIAYQMPGMRFFRHIGLIAPFAKLFLILIAGAGMDRLAANRLPRGHQGVAIVSALVGTALLALALAPASTHSALDAILLATTAVGQDQSVLADTAVTRLYLVAGFGALAAAAAIWSLRRWRHGLMCLLAVNTLQLLAWQLVLTHVKTFALTPEQLSLQKLDAIPYVPRRGIDCTSSHRFQVLRDPLFAQRVHGHYRTYGETYWFTDAYLHVDLPSSRFHTSTWMLPLDDLMRTYTHQRLRAREVPLSCWRGVLTFPLDAPSAPKLTGVSLDKIQLFSAAHSVDTPEAAAALVGDAGYAGDLLFLVGGATDKWTGGPLDANERVDARPEVMEFDANHIVIRVTSTAAWLTYADVWHPSWRATVNGAPVRVERASLAYKAVRLVAGDNIVEFRFVSPVRTWCFRLLGVNAIAWMVGLLWLLWRELRQRELAQG